MKSRDMEKNEIFKCFSQYKLNKDEEKELRVWIKKVREIQALKRETVQKEDNYQYFKHLMLPLDYRKINADLQQQRGYKVDRECYKHKKELIARNLPQEEIEKQMEDYRNELNKKYGIRLKRVKNSVDEDLTFDHLN